VKSDIPAKAAAREFRMYLEFILDKWIQDYKPTPGKEIPLWELESVLYELHMRYRCDKYTFKRYCYIENLKFYPRVNDVYVYCRNGVWTVSYMESSVNNDAIAFLPIALKRVRADATERGISTQGGAYEYELPLKKVFKDNNVIWPWNTFSEWARAWKTYAKT
jgi:hypothetical protein